MKPELVVGVDVGSQGTCAQALTPEGEQAAKLRAAHALLPAARLGGAGSTRVAGRRRDGACRGAPRRRTAAAVRALSFGSQLDGLVAADADGEPLGRR